MNIIEEYKFALAGLAIFTISFLVIRVRKIKNAAQKKG
jgi:hypothetical protein